MIFTRWSDSARRMSTAEVHAGFDAYPDDVLLFAFRTRHMSVAEHTGGFSVKIVTHGSERYLIDGREIVLVPGQVLLTNSGYWYASEINDTPTSAISWFLPDRLLPALASAHGECDSAITPESSVKLPEVPQMPFRPSQALAARLQQVGSLVDALRPVPDLLEEVVLDASATALSEASGLVRPDAFPEGMRPETRRDLIERTIAARDLVVATGGRVSLARMADAAGLSRYHFLRVFRAVTGTTPARFARSVRLADGRARLELGGTAREAARMAGYASGSTLLRSLRRH